MLEQFRLDTITQKKNLPKSKRKLSPKQVFKVDKKDFQKTAEKGMDFAWYAYQWLLRELYPYYWAVSKAHPNTDIYLIENNSSAHTRARQHLAGHPL